MRCLILFELASLNTPEEKLRIFTGTLLLC